MLIVDIPGRGALPQLTRVATGALVWHQLIREIGGAIDVDAVIREVQALAEPEKSLLDLRLSGVVHPAELVNLDRLREVVASRFPLMGRIDDTGIVSAPDDDAWSEALPAGLLLSLIHI